MPITESISKFWAFKGAKMANEKFNYELVGEKEDGSTWYLRRYPLDNKLKNLDEIIINASNIAEGGYIYCSGTSEYIGFSLYKNDDFICEIHPQLSMKPFFKNRPLKYNEKLKKWIRDE